MTLTTTSPARSTYAEIAEKAGVSKATVSRVLNGDERVHPDRAASVMLAAENLGYRPNRAARALSTGRTGLVAVVIDDEPTALSDPFWGVVLAGISRVFMANDLHSLLMVTPLDSPDGAVAHYLEGGEVDGAIFLQVHKDAVIKKAHSQGLPVVLIGRPIDADSDIPFVDTDNVGGGLQATKYLFDRGCKKVATLTGDLDASAGIDRLDGYKKAHEAEGIEVDSELIARANWSFESAKIMTLRLLAKHPEIDGIFAANDIMAIAAISAIQERGRRVPDDIAVVGFDDSLLSQTHRPAITTVRQDIIGLGAAAAETMIALLQERNPEVEVLATEIMIRESA
jgi:DNA-binding LacI/PurR family transcriptional regulator